MGHLEREAAKTRAQLAEKPQDAMLNIQLGSLLQHLDFVSPDGGRRVPEAEAAYRIAIEGAPDDRVRAGIWGNLGALLISAPGRLQDALAATERSIARGRAAAMTDSRLLAGSYFNRGKILGMLGREGDAQDAYQEAVQASLGVSPGSYAKALTAMREYGPAEAAALEEAMAYLRLSGEEAAAGAEGAAGEEQDGEEKDAFPGASSAAARRRRRRRGGGGGGAGAIGAAAEKGLEELRADWAWLDSMPAEERPWLFFAAHRAAHQQGQTGKAWAYLEKANALQRAMFFYNLEEEARIVDGLKKAFRLQQDDPATAAALAGSVGLQDETPIFVVGLPRSGSSLIEQILSSHPQAFGAGEDTAFAPLLPDLVKTLKGVGEGALRTPSDVGAAYVAAMRSRAPPGVARIVDKMLRNAYNVAYIAITLPRAAVVHAARHPLDVALSCFAQPFEGRGLPWASNLTEIVEAIRANHAVMAHWDALLPGRILHVPYEGLVADQVGWSRRLLEHCGLPWHDAVLDFHAKQRDVMTASLSQVRQKMYRTSVGRWRQYEEQLRPVAEALQPLVQEYEARWGAQGAHDEL